MRLHHRPGAVISHPAKGRAAMLAASPCGGHGPKTCPGGQAQLGPALPSRDRVSFGLQALRFCCIRGLMWGDAFPTFPCRESPRPPGEETGPRGEPSAPGSEDGGLRASLLSQFGGGDPGAVWKALSCPLPFFPLLLPTGVRAALCRSQHLLRRHVVCWRPLSRLRQVGHLATCSYFRRGCKRAV